ncbi:MAG: AAA-like domain-containing protein [Verrucomicrobiota bacterium]
MPPPNPTGEIEIAHVLFMDLVGYSRVPMHDQIRLLNELQTMLRGTDEFRRAHAGGGLIPLPTGDGMALVFFGDPESPVRCALEMARAARGSEIKLRMGIHSGPVHRVQDINANLNVSGGGINIAQRVMDCGDAGHILVSRTVADLLDQLADWSDYLHDFGLVEVKHGEKIHLFNLCKEDLGNPHLPEKLRPGAVQDTRRWTRSDFSGPETTTHVALLYKRNATPDAELLQLLEQRLAACGFKIFVDRHLTIGVEWAKEIEKQVRTADAVIPLISAESMHSEMLAYEVEIAHDAAQHQNGKPRLLPVRVHYAGPLPEPLSRILDPLQFALWEKPEDNERLVAELTAALRSPQAAPIQPPRPKLEPVGGAVPLDSKFYVVRPTDEEFRLAITRQDSIVLVKGARQMGKTSLLARGLQEARSSGAKVVLTDFQKLNASHLSSIENFFQTLGDFLADQLDLEVLPEDVWDTRRSPNTNFERYVRRQILGTISAPLVWGMDEVDRLFTCSFGSEVFGLFRAWHNERSLDPTGPWSRLTLAIAYATEAHLFITDMNQSPFNVGTRLTLEDFSFEQLSDLNARYGSPLRNSNEVARFYRLVSGYPYLVRRGLHEMVTQEMDITGFEAQADRDEGIFGDHLRRILVLLAKDPELCEIVRGVLQGKPCPMAESFYRLRSAGLMAGNSQRDVRPRCQLYATYLQRHLL